MSKAQNYTTLPQEYALFRHLDLQHDKKTALLVNVLGVIIMILTFLIGMLILPVSPLTLFDFSRGFVAYLIRWIALLGMIILYLVLHEATHGAVMLTCGHSKPHFGFTGLYAFAGSNDFFCRKDYLIIALAPAVVWTIILGLLTALVPDIWKWCLYLVQIMNISGCCGDFYVSALVFRSPETLLVQDDGVSMKMYLPE